MANEKLRENKLYFISAHDSSDDVIDHAVSQFSLLLIVPNFSLGKY